MKQNTGVQFVVMVALLATNITGGRDFGLCIRDSTGEIPCEVSESVFLQCPTIPQYCRWFLQLPAEIVLFC